MERQKSRRYRKRNGIRVENGRIWHRFRIGWNSRTGKGRTSAQSARPNALAHLYRIHEHRVFSCVFGKSATGYHLHTLDESHHALGVYIDLPPQQYGEDFRKNCCYPYHATSLAIRSRSVRSTIRLQKGTNYDELCEHVINVIKRKIQKGDLVFTLSIDFVNVFNYRYHWQLWNSRTQLSRRKRSCWLFQLTSLTLPWKKITTALAKHSVPL